MPAPKFKNIPKKVSPQPSSPNNSHREIDSTNKTKAEIKLYIEKIKKLMNDKAGQKKAAQIIKDLIDSDSKK